jgi:hypothetical protein
LQAEGERLSVRPLAALADSTHHERAELSEWLDQPFDPETVDVEGANSVLHMAETGELRPEDLDYFSPG